MVTARVRVLLCVFFSGFLISIPNKLLRGTLQLCVKSHGPINYMPCVPRMFFSSMKEQPDFY